MKQRSPVGVLLLTLITLGIYGIVWFVKTKGEMNRQGATIPTAWLIIVPFVNIWWTWKYCEGVEHVSNGKMSVGTAFVLLFVLGLFGLGVIGMAVIQNTFNSISPSVAAPAAPVAAPQAAPAAEQPQDPTPPTATPPVV